MIMLSPDGEHWHSGSRNFALLHFKIALFLPVEISARTNLCIHDVFVLIVPSFEWNES